MPLPEGMGIVVYSKADCGNQVGGEDWNLLGAVTVSIDETSSPSNISMHIYIYI